jgi:hypothetical protein
MLRGVRHKLMKKQDQVSSRFGFNVDFWPAGFQLALTIGCKFLQQQSHDVDGLIAPAYQ